ncbi:hypothetical protein NT6N_19060 [Oceaniferula spumae]|uniref:B12-binding domain-containing protein n=1 Tax=Oceaniferula spumae TaxID=2979115 RepID=A0AAT9FLI9_9BACT
MESHVIRILTAVPLCDGHDSAVCTVNQELIRAGIEVIYLGYHRSVADIVRAAVQEDVAAVGLSSYNGGHVEFFREVVQGLKAAGADDIGVFGGGGGTITPPDADQMMKDGTDKIFFAGTSFAEMTDYIKKQYARDLDCSSVDTSLTNHRALGRLLSCVEEGGIGEPEEGKSDTVRVVGITGPGGAGKTTLIDELVRNYLEQQPDARVAVLSHDPSAVSKGALLGDRATMVYAQDDRVFMRSLGTRGREGGLSPATEPCLHWLAGKQANFDLVLVETVGTGQEALPFRDNLVDVKIMVMNTDYGARLQLQKILMLEEADVVVANKADRPGSETTVSELNNHLEMLGGDRTLVSTIASRHGDPGVAQLLERILT